MRDLLTAVKNERLYPIIYVTALYGLRRSEVLGLKWDSINFAMQTLTIRHTVARVTKVVEKNKTKNASSFRSLHRICQNFLALAQTGIVHPFILIPYSAIPDSYLDGVQIGYTVN